MKQVKYSFRFLALVLPVYIRSFRLVRLQHVIDWFQSRWLAPQNTISSFYQGASLQRTQRSEGCKRLSANILCYSMVGSSEMSAKDFSLFRRVFDFLTGLHLNKKTWECIVSSLFFLFPVPSFFKVIMFLFAYALDLLYIVSRSFRPYTLQLFLRRKTFPNFL